jgi:poly(A) polymerase
MKTFKLLNSLAKERKAKIYLVGGYLRDLILERENKDLDFVLAGRFTDFVKEFAKRINGTFFLLNDRYQTNRVIDKKNGFTYDFTRMRGRSIEEDLKKRDFTINALALDLEKPVPLKVIDPHKGREDIQKRVIRVISEEAFTDDPLRLLRSIRFRALLNFKIEKRTEKLIIQKAPLLKKVSGERTQIIPEIEALRKTDQEGFHHLDVWEHSLETLRHTEEILKDLNKLFPKFYEKISKHLKEEIANKQPRITLLKLTTLFHDLGKPQTQAITPEGRMRFIGHEEKGVEMAGEIGKRLRLSRKAIETVKREILYHMRPGNLSGVPELTNRAIFRFFRDCKEEGVETLILSYGDRLASCGPLATPGMIKRHREVVEEMLGDYYERKSIVKPKKLVNGNEIMKRFKLSPGPKIGELLETLSEAQAEGKVKTKKETFKFIKRALES